MTHVVYAVCSPPPAEDGDSGGGRGAPEDGDGLGPPGEEGLGGAPEGGLGP